MTLKTGEAGNGKCRPLLFKRQVVFRIHNFRTTLYSIMALRYKASMLSKIPTAWKILPDNDLAHDVLFIMIVYVLP